MYRDNRASSLLVLFVLVLSIAIDCPRQSADTVKDSLVKSTVHLNIFVSVYPTLGLFE